MSIAFVLGNGISRKGIPLDDLSQQGFLYGCNALYREFTPWVLVATDTPIATAIQDTGYAKTNRFYTRKPKVGSGAHRVPQEYYGFSSGPVAVGIAADDAMERIYLVGFDLGPDANNKFNNVYAGTEFYKTVDAVPTYTGNWIRQIKTVVKKYPKTQFIRVCGPTTADIDDFRHVSNFSSMDMATFLDRINKQKDL